MACSRNQDLYCGKILLYFQENRPNIRNKKRSYRWQTARRICANALAWRLPKHARLSHMCYHAEFGRSALNDVHINTGEPQNWGDLELRSFGVGSVAGHKIHVCPQYCVTTSN